VRPDHLTGDKAYSSRANRTALRTRHIRHTIPERDDQKANRARKGATGGRPPAFDRVRYRNRNQVERLMNRRKQFRAVATRFDSSPTATRPRSVSRTSSSGYGPDPTAPAAIRETRPRRTGAAALLEATLTLARLSGSRLRYVLADQYEMMEPGED
jgi:transposase